VGSALAGLADLGGGADAASTDLEAARDAVDGQGLDVNVGAEDAVGLGRLALPATGMLVANVTPEGCALAADFTFGCHSRRRVTKARGLGQAEELPGHTKTCQQQI
jgi:hypothetical protein